jgi:hypothetical protein
MVKIQQEILMEGRQWVRHIKQEELLERQSKRYLWRAEQWVRHNKRCGNGWKDRQWARYNKKLLMEKNMAMSETQLAEVRSFYCFRFLYLCSFSRN